MTKKYHSPKVETAIAVIGIGCRFPRGENPQAFEDMLRAGADAVCRVPSNRWDRDKYYDPDPNASGKMYTDQGAFLDEIAGFDHRFFGIAPREAESMDPQQRLLLEVCWEALEDAGIAPNSLEGSATGVFMGLCFDDYSRRSLNSGTCSPIDAYTITGNAFSVASGRISYVLGLNGPNIQIDTACSSSLVAVDLACRSLLDGESETALAGGVNLMLSPEVTVGFCKLRVLSPDGRCKTFDASGNGYARGEGCGVVVLKRLSDTLRDGDPIQGLIRGSAVNQDGRGNGLTAPNGRAQEAVIRRALKRAKLTPLDIDVVEAHGTGTQLGDPIEAAALGMVLGRDRPDDDPYYLGSVKTNIGHLESAAGIASLIKLLLAMRCGEIPPHLHLKEINPRISLESIKALIPVKPTPWPSRGKPRIAGVSSFGISGTNAHVILEEAPRRATPAQVPGTWHIMPISARNDAALKMLAGSFADVLQTTEQDDLPAVCATAALGRAHFKEARVAVVGDSSTSMRCALLETPDIGPPVGRTAFLFSGVGGQYPGMGRTLFESGGAFRDTLEACEEVLESHLTKPLRQIIFPSVVDQSLLEQPAYLIPALFSFEYALARQWLDWGVQPDVLLGYGVGELVAVCIAEALGLEDALQIAVFYGQAISEQARHHGSATVFANESQVESALEEHSSSLWLTAVNSSEELEVAGDVDALKGFLQKLQMQGIRTRRGRGFHGPPTTIDGVREFVERARVSNPRIMVISSIDGLPVGHRVQDPAYWCEQLKSTIRFTYGLDATVAHGTRIFLEIGPKPQLARWASQHLPESSHTILASLQPGIDDRRHMLKGLAVLYRGGAEVNWGRVLDESLPRRSGLPTYPFQRVRHWYAPDESAAPAQPQKDVADWIYETAWRPLSPRFHDLKPGRLLVFTRNEEGETLLAALSLAGHACTKVKPASTFADLGDEGYRLDPLQPQHFEQLLETLPESPLGVVFAWSLETLPGEEPALEEIESAQAFDCGALLHLSQALIKAEQQARISVLTRGSVRLGDDKPPDVRHMPVWALVRTIMLEHPNLKIDLVDLDPSGAPAQISALQVRGEVEVAWRNGICYGARLIRRPTPLPLTAPRFHGDRGYLITGGLGALGCKMSIWLVENGVRHLVLCARRPPSPEAAGQIETLKSQGINVLVKTVDLAESAQVFAMFAELKREMPPLAGVIHAAGVLDDGILLNQTWARFAEVMRPKISGSWNVHRACADLELDFFVGFSSATSLIGLASQSNYGAANGFIDGLVQYRRALGLPALGVQWSVWREVGMVASMDARVMKTLEAQGYGSIPTSRGLEALGRLINGGDTLVGVIPNPISDLKALFPNKRLPSFFSELIETSAESEDEREAAPFLEEFQTASPERRLALLLPFISDRIRTIMHLHEPLEPDADIFDIGLDSLMAVELKNTLENDLKLTIPTTAAFEHPSVAGLARSIAHLPERGERTESETRPPQMTCRQTKPVRKALPNVPAVEPIQRGEEAPAAALPFSLLFFSSNESEFEEGKYDLFLESARYADQNGFHAVWMPERHFHAFGGIYPNPALLASALAMTTKNVRLRSGSVVLPLHSPILIAEDWAVVDNLSRGRVDVAFARGWNPEDFVISPDTFEDNRDVLYQRMDVFRRLWRGETLPFTNGVGKTSEVKIFPQPMQGELNLWLTCTGGEERFREAGAKGLNVLTALLFQPLEELEGKIRVYREARAQNGHAPEAGVVSLMLHTFVHEDMNHVREVIRAPFIEYLKSSVNLWRRSMENLDRLSDAEREDLYQIAFERYYQSSGLMGTPETCSGMIDRLRSAGVNEIACLIDFGVEPRHIRSALPHLKKLMQSTNAAPSSEPKRRRVHSAPAQGQRLSHGQRALWLHHKLHPESHAYHSNFAARIVNGADESTLRRVFEQLTTRHHQLRARICEAQETPTVFTDGQPVFEVIDAHGWEETQIRKAATSAYRRPFDLSKNVTRMTYFRCARPLMVWTIHHLVMDLWTIDMLVRELQELLQGRTLASSPPEYREFVQAEEALLSSETGTRLATYWEKRLADRPQPLDLGSDFVGSRGRRGNAHQFSLSQELSEKVENIARELGATPYMLLFTTFFAFLQRRTLREDLVVGTPALNRSQRSWNDTAGYFANLIPVRVDVNSSLSFRDLLVQVRARLLEDMEHQAYPFEFMSRDSATQLVQAVFLMQIPPTFPELGLFFSEGAEGRVSFGNMLFEPYFIAQQEGMFDFILEMRKAGGILAGSLKFDAELFELESVAAAADQYVNMLEQAMDAPDAPIADLHPAPLPDDDSAYGPALADPIPAHRRVEMWATKRPHSPALRNHESAWTYGELNRRANNIAAQLHAKGVGGESLVALYLDRSFELIAAMLAVLKTGAAYLPLDPSNPPARQKLILEDAAPMLLIQRGDDGPDFQGVILDVTQVPSEPVADLDATVSPKSAAYVVYTSGSTGTPKGVVVTQRNLARLFDTNRGLFNFGPTDIWTLFHSPGFDFSVWEIWGALTTGGVLVVVPYEVSRSPHSFHGLLQRESVTVLNQTPSAFRQLMRADVEQPRLEKLRLVIFGGETLVFSDLKAWFERYVDAQPTLINMFGITETCVHVTHHVVKSRDASTARRSSVGIPLDDLRLYVLDQKFKHTAVGAIGKLFVGGAGPARGYLDKPALTAERFLPDPFSKEPGARMYHSGDLGQRRHNGEVIYLGRDDRQVQLRGFRIEVAEIEAVLRTYPGVSDAAILQAGTGEHQHLSAYVAADDVEASDLHTYISQQCPAYMVPAHFTLLDELPLTNNGKLDHAALASLTVADTPTPAAPASESEQKVAEAWHLILNREDVAPNHNFFDLGGNSLLMVRLYEQLRSRFTRDFTVIDLFNHTTVAAQAEFLTGGRAHQVYDPTQANEEAGIAVIGMAGRFPGAPDTETFWKNLVDGVCSISREPGEGDRVAAKGILAEADCFDADFFSMTPAEAKLTDPQIRVFLETCHHALEHAGYAVNGGLEAGVYAGMSLNTYLLFQLAGRLDSEDPFAYFPIQILNDKDFLTSRAAYALNLTGPSVTVQTACSTSLTAVVQACRDLRDGACHIALAGGVSVSVPLEGGYRHQPGMIASPDGICRAFDAKAAGAVPGDGSAVVVLKRLDQALADGDTVHAVLRGAAANNSGGARVGYTAPGQQGQSAVINSALRQSGLNIDDIDYIEAHGTGTPLGDPIELAALNEVFSTRETPAAIGSVKTNIGHLDTAAGVAGLIKAVHAVQHGILPPSLHFEEPNPDIDFSTFVVVTESRPWPEGRTGPRRAGVSSFGIGGGNAHVIVEQPPPNDQSPASLEPQLLLFSAKSSAALKRQCKAFSEFLSHRPETNMDDLAYTLAAGRCRFEVCRSIVASTPAEAAKRLNSRYEPQSSEGEAALWLFPGQGSEVAGMGRTLFESNAVFRDWFNRASDYLKPILDADIREIAFSEDDPRLHQTVYTQPILFAIQTAYGMVWRSWGQSPVGMIGHSIGEYSAAYFAGVFSFEDGLALTAARGKLFEHITAGGMTAVSLDGGGTAPLLGPELDIAAFNGPRQTVVAGPHHALDTLEAHLEIEGVRYRRLATSHAFHSRALDPVLDSFRRRLAEVHLQQPTSTWVSNLSGASISPDEVVDPEYWVRHLREPVDFNQGLKCLLAQSQGPLVEMGSGAALTRMAVGRSRRKAFAGFNAATSCQAVLEQIGRVWETTRKAEPPPRLGRRRVPLPLYPFERQRFWVEAENRPSTPEQSLCVYLPAWRRTDAATDETSPSRWMLLPGKSPRAQGLADVTSNRDKAIVIAETGPRFTRLDKQRITFREGESGYRELFESIAQSDEIPDGIIDARGLENRSDYSESLIAMTQAYARTFPGQSLVLVTAVQAETVEAAEATAICTTIPQELPELDLRCIALGREHIRPGLTEILFAAGRGPRETVVSTYRSGRCYRPYYRPFNVEVGEASTALKCGGVYLITGGMGRLGIALADFLAEHYFAHLILTTRHEPKTEFLGKIEAIKNRASSLQITKADCADVDAMRALIAEIQTFHGGIQGVFHLAAVAAEDTVVPAVSVDTRSMADHRRPKLDGLRALEVALADHSPDFCVLFSSLAAELGGLGFTAYAAANRAMDAYADQLDACGRFPWISINWDGWRDAEHPLGIPLEDGMRLLERVLTANPGPRLLVACGDLQDRRPQPVQPQASSSPPDADEYCAPRNNLEQTIVGIWHDLLGVDKISVFASFAELGGHSLLATQLASRLRACFQVDIPVRDIYEHATPAELSIHVVRRLAELTGETDLERLLEE